MMIFSPSTLPITLCFELQMQEDTFIFVIFEAPQVDIFLEILLSVDSACHVVSLKPVYTQGDNVLEVYCLYRTGPGTASAACSKAVLGTAAHKVSPFFLDGHKGIFRTFLIAAPAVKTVCHRDFKGDSYVSYNLYRTLPVSSMSFAALFSIMAFSTGSGKGGYLYIFMNFLYNFMFMPSVQ